MKPHLEELLAAALARITGSVLPEPVDPASIVVERTRGAEFGDFQTNLALRLAKRAGRPPRELAAAIVAALPASPLLARTEIAGAGFINFFLATDAATGELRRVHEQGAAYGRSVSGSGRSVILEFVSANPTGPLHVGHGRQAAYGATLGNLLEATGWTVHREYYINDAGRQMDILTLSVWLRYLEIWRARREGDDTFADSPAFPANGYRGDYVRDLGARLAEVVGDRLYRDPPAVFTDLPPDAPVGDKDVYVDALIGRMRGLLGATAYGEVLEIGLQTMLAGIREDLAEFGVAFDRWYSERELAASGAIDRALGQLERDGRLYRKDGALWFRATEFGDDEDRVVERENGARTYFASDIAYHKDKRRRGFERSIDVLGADHHGYVARVRGGLAALGEPPDSLEVCLIQFVSLYRGGEKIPMGKREAQFVTLRQLREEVGNDACRLFYLMRSNDQHLDFDLELAKARNNENPVFYIQYAHARVASVMKQLAARGLELDLPQGLGSLEFLVSEHEQAALTAVGRFPEVVEQAAAHRAPHALVHYLRELANTLHSWYNAEQFIVADGRLRNARLALALGLQQVVRNGLGLLGIQAPESM